MIPIANVYYLLCYAWDFPLSRDRVRISALPFRHLPDLLAALLVRETEGLLKRGLDRGYTTVTEESTRPRGKLDLAATLKRIGPTVVCASDDLTHDTPQNRILKATLQTLARCAEVNQAARCHALALRLADVSDTALSPSTFAAVRLNRNNRRYGFLLQLCRLLFENRLPDPTPGEVMFADFLRDDRQMARVFEAFVRNFYRREQAAFPRVASERFGWRDVQASPADRDLLPEMRTDVALTAPTRKLVIDAKFYRETLSSRFDTPSVHAANLYQLLAYLQNQEAKPGQVLEGLLLYPTTGRELNLSYVLHGQRVRVATVDLGQPWPAIHARMLELIEGTQ